MHGDMPNPHSRTLVLIINHILVIPHVWEGLDTKGGRHSDQGAIFDKVI
jgi:hypothetical protein